MQLLVHLGNMCYKAALCQYTSTKSHVRNNSTDPAERARAQRFAVLQSALKAKLTLKTAYKRVSG